MMLMKPQYEIISYGSNSNISALVEELALTLHSPEKLIEQKQLLVMSLLHQRQAHWLAFSHPWSVTTHNSDKLVTVRKFSEGFNCFSVLSN